MVVQVAEPVASREAAEGERAPRREVVAHDRNNPDRYMIFAFFDSYESATERSNLPKTQEFSARFDDFTDGPLTFRDLDMIERDT